MSICILLGCVKILVRNLQHGTIIKRMPSGILKFLPQDHAADVYQLVRLEAGTLHLAKYLIRIAVYILSAKVNVYLGIARILCEQL